MSYVIPYKPMKALPLHQNQHGKFTSVYVWGQSGNGQLAAGMKRFHERLSCDRRNRL